MNAIDKASAVVLEASKAAGKLEQSIQSVAIANARLVTQDREMNEAYKKSVVILDSMTAAEKKALDAKLSDARATAALEEKQEKLNKVMAAGKDFAAGLGIPIDALANPAMAAGQAIGALASFTVDATKASVAYNKQVREMSTAIGLGAEETSRIIQVSDDWGISIEDVRTALSMMTKNGVQPSISNLADLADEFVNTTDKTAFAEKASKMLGRGWMTLIPILKDGGDAFREQAAAVDDSLIATEESMAASREYEVVMDDLGDAVDGLKYRIGNGLIPTLVELASKMTGAIDVHTALLGAVDDGVISQGQAILLGNQYNLGLKEQEDIQAELIVAYQKAEAAKRKELEATGLSTDALIEERRALREASDVIRPFTEYTDGLAVATDLVADAYRRSIEPTDDFAAANARVAISIGDVTKASLGKDALDALTKAYQEGTISEMEYDKQARFIMGSLLGMPDSSIVAQETLQDLNEDLADGKITSQEYAKALFDMGINLDNLNGKKAYIDVYTTFHEQTVTSPGSSGGSGTGSGTFAPGQGGAQHGADFIVPPGYNENFNLPPVSSGEHVSIQPTNTWNIYTNGGMGSFTRDYNVRKALAR